jgi:hypothetical protein
LLVSAIIMSNTRSTFEVDILIGISSKLSPKKLPTKVHYVHETQEYNHVWHIHMELGKTYIRDDTILMQSCNNHVVANEICWPIVQKKGVLVRMLPKVRRGIELIDNTLINIHKPWNTKSHMRTFNGRKKIYSMKNIMVFD